MIKHVFSTSFTVSLQDVLDHGARNHFTTQQVVETLNLMIGVPIALESRDGRKLYVTRNGDTLFLIADRNILTWVHDRDWLSSYAKTPCFQAFSTFSELSHHMTEYKDIFTEFFETVVRRQDAEGIRLYNLLSPTVQNEIVKVILQALEDKVENEWIDWAVKNLYKDDIVQRPPHGWVYLLDKSPAKVVHGEFVFLDTTEEQHQQQQGGGEASAVEDDDTTSEDHGAPAFVQRYITDNPLKRYAYVKNGAFKIRDVSKDESLIKDQKGKTTGMSCTSYRSSELLHIMWKLGGRFPVEAPPTTEKKLANAYAQLVQAPKKLLQQLFNSSVSNATMKKTWTEFSSSTPVPKSGEEDRLKFFLYHVLVKRNDLCPVLQQLFEEHGLLAKPPRS
jgi:hypothetical protein